MINFITNLFNKPTYQWTAGEGIIFSLILIAALLVAIVILYGLYSFLHFILSKKQSRCKSPRNFRCLDCMNCLGCPDYRRK